MGSQMEVRLSAPRAYSHLPQGRFLAFISVRGWVYPRAIVRLEGLGQLKNSNYLIGNQPVTFISDIFKKIKHMRKYMVCHCTVVFQSNDAI
jgi:hypothetical protein